MTQSIASTPHKERSVRAASLCGAVVLALCGVSPAVANGLGESLSWQFQTSQDRVNKGAVLDLIERKKGGYYDAIKTNTNIKRFESTPLALKELEAGGVDAVVADNGVVVHYVANNPGGKFKTVADKDFVPEQYGIALKKGNTELQAKLNQGLAAIKADGTYDRIYTQYFGAPTARAAVAPASAASK